ncbi:hypothetical protein MVEN_01514900 [Mycena venus]|uniref:AMP-dependent synthetase/ligase domain-containing protein n=1 Tax=Mycena venus TaxID=2733690 RepID=A0A8H6XUT7_9AGAR|nr:hypothetical protein MVEN_01514900 [Mycena venus]
MLDDAYFPIQTDWVCLIDDSTGRQLRFSELRSRTGYLCAALYEQCGLRSGDIVALVSSNDIGMLLQSCDLFEIFNSRKITPFVSGHVSVLEPPLRTNKFYLSL